MFYNRILIIAVIQQLICSNESIGTCKTQGKKRHRDTIYQNNKHNDRCKRILTGEYVVVSQDNVNNNFGSQHTDFCFAQNQFNPLNHCENNDEQPTNDGESERPNNGFNALDQQISQETDVVHNEFIRTDNNEGSLHKDTADKLDQQDNMQTKQTDITNTSVTETACSDNQTILQDISQEELLFIYNKLEQAILDENTVKGFYNLQCFDSETVNTSTYPNMHNNQTTSCAGQNVYKTTTSASMQFTCKQGLDYYNPKPTYKAPNQHSKDSLELVDTLNKGAINFKALIVARDGEVASICFFNTLYKSLVLESNSKTNLTKGALYNTYIKTIESLIGMGYKHIYEMSTHLNEIRYSQDFSYSEFLVKVNIVMNKNSSGDKSINVTNSVLIEIKDIKNTDFHKSDILPDQSELNIFLLHSKNIFKESYLTFMRELCFEKHEKSQLYVLKKELWGLHVYMAEFYFYIMWKIKKVTEIAFAAPDTETLFIEHLKIETEIIYNIIKKYITIYQSQEDASTVSDELKSLVTEFRTTIMNYLEVFHSKSTEEAFYFMALNNGNHAIYNSRVSVDKNNGNKMSAVKITQKRKLVGSPKLGYFKVQSTKMHEKPTNKNMLFIYAFTFYCASYPNFSAQYIKDYAKSRDRSFMYVFKMKFWQKQLFRELCFNTVINVSIFIKDVKCISEDNENILLMYPNRYYSLFLYINTGNNKRYELKILPCSSALYFLSEYIRSFMW